MMGRATVARLGRVVRFSRVIRFSSAFVAAVLVGCDAADPSHEPYAAIVAEEDARGGAGFESIDNGLAAEDPQVRAYAVRALGRQEDPDLVDRIEPLLSDGHPRVRQAAWFAASQALYGDPAMARILALGDQAEAESDPAVLGAMATSIGWAGVSEGDGATMQRGVEGLARLAERISGADDSGYRGRLGLARGMEAMARSHGANPGVGEALAALANPLLGLGRDGSSVEAARVRRLALATVGATGGASAEVLIQAAQDPDAEVRRTAFGLIARLGLGYRETVDEGLSDPSPTVRVQALAAWDRWVRPRSDCEAAYDRTDDENPGVALTAIDLLRRPCGDVQAQRAFLMEIVDDTSSTWHRPAHALMALAGLAPEQARGALESFRTHASPFARAWAARAAAEAADLESLSSLAADDDANVRTAALIGLTSAGATGHGPFLEALAGDDPQLVMTALGGLSPLDAEHAAGALEALQRFAGFARWTDRDVRMAALEFLSGSPHWSDTDLEPYLADFDPVVATRAARLLEDRGIAASANPGSPGDTPTPTAARLATLARSQVVLDMAAEPGKDPVGRVVVALRPDLAATNADRFARLVEAGTLNGLTFHRVVPNFVIQGGSPGANEYAGHGDYTRDEISSEGHWRGMVGLSTRGRDTGDAQIFVNLIDNTRLDFNYTILGEVTEGMDVVDRLAEGAIIRTARLERRRSP